MCKISRRNQCPPSATRSSSSFSIDEVLSSSASASSLVFMLDELSLTTAKVEKAVERLSQRNSRKLESVKTDDEEECSKLAKANIVDFLNAIGEQTADMNVSLVNKYTNKRLLKLSSEWSQNLTPIEQDGGDNEEKKDFDVGSHTPSSSPLKQQNNDDDGELDLQLTAASLSWECAYREVCAIALLAAMESASARLSVFSRTSPDVWDDNDDDGAFGELFIAETVASSDIRKELQGVKELPTLPRRQRRGMERKRHKLSLQLSKQQRRYLSKSYHGVHIQSGREQMESACQQYPVPSRFM